MDVAQVYSELSMLIHDTHIVVWLLHEKCYCCYCNLSFAVEGQVKEKSRWFTSLIDLTRKLKVMKMEHIKLSEEALSYKNCVADMEEMSSTIVSTSRYNVFFSRCKVGFKQCRTPLFRRISILLSYFSNLEGRGSGNLTWESSFTARFRALLCLHAMLVDELEKSIDELRAEMGVEGSPSPLAPSKVMTEEGSA
ncbi:hypothetical protein DKX38_021297 [Salix brachista]|uniref:Uncharacterized protein n=1 Tax=Salix brachista TaxID=2182728 RepID=A0A5N5KBJ6_9ROSI|nr:hypothetical protein DKX38_021297 [Salix brachista]